MRRRRAPNGGVTAAAATTATTTPARHAKCVNEHVTTITRPSRKNNVFRHKSINTLTGCGALLLSSAPQHPAATTAATQHNTTKESSRIIDAIQNHRPKQVVSPPGARRCVCCRICCHSVRRTAAPHPSPPSHTSQPPVRAVATTSFPPQRRNGRCPPLRCGGDGFAFCVSPACVWYVCVYLCVCDGGM